MSKDKKAPWVKWFARDFLDGVLFKLNIEAIGVYSVLLNLIYDNGGPIEDNIPVLARRMSMRPTSLQKRLNELVAAKKIIRIDGVISNNRAEIEIEARVQKMKETREKVDEKSIKTRGNLPEKVNGFNGGHRQEGEGEKDKKRTTPYSPPRKAPKATRLDPHRKISDSNIVFARSRGLTKREIEHEWMIFVRYYASRPESATNSKSMDWDAVWESWVLKKAHELNREPLVDDCTSNSKLNPTNFPREVWVRQIEMWRNGISWNDSFGPEPGNPGCLAPPDLVNPS